MGFCVWIGLWADEERCMFRESAGGRGGGRENRGILPRVRVWLVQECVDVGLGPFL